MAPALVVKAPEFVPSPSHEEITSVLNTIFNTAKAQDSLDASYKLTDLVANSLGFRGLRRYGILDEIRKAATNKKDGAKREGAMFALGALFEKFPRVQPLSEVVILLQEEALVSLALMRSLTRARRCGKALSMRWTRYSTT